MFKIAPCSHEAAKYAVMNWHYSKTMPSGKLVKYGVWEDEKFIGVILYGYGANGQLPKLFGLVQTECAELVRVALTSHRTPVSQLIAETLKQLKTDNPGLRLAVSYADTEQGHKGGIYQAGNWTYTGTANTAGGSVILNGQKIHGRSIVAKYGTRSIEWLKANIDPNARAADDYAKHRYIMPLDKAMRRKIASMAKEYPHAVEGSKVSRISSSDEV